jgi:hypothetical protein
MRHSKTAPDNFRIPHSTTSAPETGSFDMGDPISIPAQGCEVVGCAEFECGSPADGEETPEARQPTTYNSDKAEIEENIDLNTISPDPNSLPPFPIWGLPLLLQKLIKQGAAVYGVPQEFFATNILCAVAAAVRKRVIHKDKYTNYPQIWGMIVAPSGIGKSEPLSIAFAPLFKKDSDSDAQYKQEVSKWEAECATVRSNNKKSRGNQQPEPPKPRCYQVLIQDTTPEALFKEIAINNGLTLCRDELSGWFSDFGRYNKSGELGHYLSIFNNKQLKINRKSEDMLLVNDPYLSIIGSIQPDILAECMGNRQMTQSGFVQRFLFVFPDEVIKADPNEDIMPPELLADYDNFFKSLSKIDTQLELTMSVEAKSILMAFRREMARMDRTTDTDYLKSMYGKMEIHIIRLVLIVHVAQMISDTGEADISGEVMRYCVELCRYFIATGEKVYHLISEPQRKQAISNEELIKLLDERYDIKSQTKLAEALGVSQQAISKFLKK